MEDTSINFGEFSIRRFILGGLAGVGAGTVLIIVGIFAAITFRSAHDAFWLAPWVNAGLLLVALVFTARLKSDRGFARGLLVGLSLVFILNVLCGVNTGT